ncbi:unnamed protein product, partial [marine sediment metagenome]
KSKENMLLQELNSLTVECLPDEIPASVKVDLSSLTEGDQAIRVEDVILGKKVAILNNPELVVVKIGSRPKEEVVEAEEAVEAAEAPEEAPLPEDESKEE